MRYLSLAIVAVTAAVTFTNAWGQTDRPINIFVPAIAGSAPDIIARILGDELRKDLKQTTLVENRPGAGGIVAVMAAKASSNSNTLLLAQAAVVAVTPLTYRAAKFDLEKDMEPVAVVASTPMMFVSSAQAGPKTLADAIASVRSNPESISMGSTARSSIPHLTAELLAQMSGAHFNVVPMANTNQAIQAVANGDTQVSVDGVAPLLSLVKSGRLRVLGVSSAKPLPGLEGCPLVKDTVPGLVATGWFMLFAKKGTQPERINALNEAVNKALKSPEVLQRLAATANYPVGGSVSEAKVFLAKEKQLWAQAVQRAGLKPE